MTPKMNFYIGPIISVILLLVMIAGGCKRESCFDGKRNQNEIGVDCGGDCPACPNCVDGIKNGDEEGVDCGGICPPCPAPETCSDGIKNQDETGIDCGGVCPPCVASLVYDSVVFDVDHAFFALDGSMTQPVDSFTAKTIVPQIGLVYSFNYGGFINNKVAFQDPSTRAVLGYSDVTVLPWLSGCEEINIYSLLKDSIWAYKEQFLADEQLIAELIKNPNFSRLALHDVYPDGKNIGGDKDQLSHLGNSWENLMIFDPFGIEIVSSQKYGIVFIRDDQEKSGPGPWPELAVPPYRVKVDIYMQH